MTAFAQDITGVTVVRHGVPCLEFADGLIGDVDLLDRMRGPVFEQARTPDGFARVSVDPELGSGRGQRHQPGGSERTTPFKVADRADERQRASIETMLKVHPSRADNRDRAAHEAALVVPGDVALTHG